MHKLYISKDKNLLENILNENGFQVSDLSYNDYGKPYLKDSDFYFNKSNKYEYTVVVISDHNVGVDIEKITYRESVMRKLFNQQETQLVKSNKNFTDIFTKKEAYSKYVGKGLNMGLENIDTTKLTFETIYFEDYIINIYLGNEGS